ncbi:hypothetical protein M433DRAFT_158173 [Acidomyces richmondensis BFW]|nr:MAG: hypothetical protein FE78DRAFT_85054 [Acidomyces sp. 'richmondensis']KYG42193.1 hypothetical protein M433DRAFT_158173 [Acidomyces richmondensis BFW]
MRWHLLICSAFTCTLAICQSIEGRTVPEVIHAIGDTDAFHVQMLYDTLGGTFILPIEGANGQNLTITGLHMVKGNGTATQLDQRGLDTRAPAYSISGYTCANPPTDLDRLLTLEQRRFIDGKFCIFLANSQPTVWSLVGLTVSNLLCGINFKYVCQGIWTVSSAIAGQYIGPGIQANCAASLAELDNECGEKGGQQMVSISGGSKFLEEAFATQESGTECKSDPNEGGEHCETYTCNGNCNPNGGTP